MKKILLFSLLALIFSVNDAFGQIAKNDHIIGFYNLENLFDTYDDPVKNDAEYLPDGKNKWTDAKYQKKLSNMAKVIRSMAKDNGRFHTILGISEVENRLVVEDLVADPQIAEANYQIVHFDSPDRRGIDVALLYRPDQFEVLETESIPYDFNSPTIDFVMSKEEQDYFKTRDVLMVHGLLEGEHFAFYVAHLPSRAGDKKGSYQLRDRGGEIIYLHAMEMQKKYPGIKIVCMGDMNDNPTDSSMADYLHGKETPEEVGKDDFFSPYISMLKSGYGSLAYRGVWSIYDLELVNYNLLNAPDGGLKLKQTIKGKRKSKGFYGAVYNKPWMRTAEGQYKGYPFRTFSNGSFIGGYSDHFPTFIVVGK